MTKQKQWFLIRGLGREVRHWGHFPEFLRMETNDLVICLETPGTGVKYLKDPPLNIDQYVFDLRADYLNQKGDSDCYLVAISLGGMIAQKWIELYPDDFEKIFIINSSGGSLSPFYERLKPKAMMRLVQILRTKDISTRERLILQATTNLVKIDNALLADRVKIAEEYPIKIKNLLKQLWAAKSFSPGQSELKKLIVIASKKDRFVSCECSITLAEFHQCEIMLHPEAGHDLPLDDPNWLVRSLSNSVSA